MLVSKVLPLRRFQAGNQSYIILPQVSRKGRVDGRVIPVRSQ